MSNQYTSLKIERADLNASLILIKNYATGIMNDIIDRYYTDHSILHSDRIIKLINQILWQNGKDKYLTDSEKYVLNTSAYLHDVGMQAESEIENSESRRIAHHNLSSEIITEHWSEMGILQPYVSAIGIVVSGHRGNIEEKHKSVSLGTAENIRCSLLAALLCIADELDISFERVNPNKLDYFNYPTESLLHFYQHWFTQGVNIEDNRCVGITFRYPKNRSSQYHSLFGKRVVEKLKRVVNELTSHLQLDHGLIIAVRSEDIHIIEDQSLKLIDPEIYSELVAESLGIRNFRIIKSIRFEQRIGDIQPELFYKGNVRWEDIVNNLDIIRSQYQEILQAIKLLYGRACTKQCLNGYLICGEGGSGKTTMLMRLAYEFSKMEEYSDINLLWFPDDSLFNIDQLQQLYYANQKPIIVFIDGLSINKTVESIIGQFSGPELKAFPLLLIFASRLNEWDNAKGDDIPFSHFGRIQLQTLTDLEINKLLDKLEENNQLYQLENLSKAERFSRFKDRSEGQLLVAMLEATRGKKFFDIIFDEYNYLLKSYPMAGKAYEYICLFFSYGVLIPSELLITLVGCSDKDDFQGEVLNHTRLVIVAHPDTRFGVKYRPRHQVIASVLLEQLPDYRGLPNRLRRAARVLRQIQNDKRQERYVILEFLENIIVDAKRGPKDQYLDNIAEIKSFIRLRNEKIEEFQRYCISEKYIPELVHWSKLFRDLLMIDEQMSSLRAILTIDKYDRKANYVLAKILSRGKVPNIDPEKVVEYYYGSYLGGNRRMLFLYDYLLYCIKNRLFDHLDRLVGSFGDFVSFTPEEESLRNKIKSLIEGYKISKDREKLAGDFAYLERHLHATRELNPAAELAYVDLFESGNPLLALNRYETYLLTLHPLKPKNILLRIAHLASKVQGMENKALDYFAELYATYIKPDSDPGNFEIVLEYAELNSRYRKDNKAENYVLFRECIRLKPHELQSYISFATYAKELGDNKVAHSVASQGIEMSKNLYKYESRPALRLRDLFDQARISPLS